MVATGFELASNHAKRESGLRTLEYQHHQNIACGAAVELLAQQTLFWDSSLHALGSVSITPILNTN
jgi:hypothetical protein